MIGAHPDDIEIGAGGAAAIYSGSSDTVIAVDITDGEETPMGSREIRAAESNSSNKILKFSERVCLDEPNRVLMDTEEARVKLAVEIRRTKPDIIITHYQEDAHPDHVAAYNITKGAILLSRIHKIDLPHDPWSPGRVYYYPSYHLKKSYQPTFILKLTEEQFTKKIDAIKCYESQFVWHEPNKHVFTMVETRMRYFGQMIGAEFGEPYFCDSPPGLHSLSEII